MSVIKVTDATFEREVLAAELPVLVDLTAVWCEPCKVLSPIVAQVATELAGKLKVVEVDVDRSPMVAQSFRVQSIPMLVLIAGGRIVDQLLGLVDKAAILRMVKPVLPAAANEIAPRELAELIARRRVQPVDVREAPYFARYRIPGAVNLPAGEVLARAKELAPVDGRVRVLYGRSGDEARTLAESLRAQGVDVGFLAGGFLHWEADGFEVERGQPGAG
jgi:thioredoxin 1